MPRRRATNVARSRRATKASHSTPISIEGPVGLGPLLNGLLCVGIPDSGDSEVGSAIVVIFIKSNSLLTFRERPPLESPRGGVPIGSSMAGPWAVSVRDSAAIFPEGEVGRWRVTVHVVSKSARLCSGRALYLSGSSS